MIRQKRVDELAWAPMVKALRHRAATKKFDLLNDRLSNIRKSFRNPAENPNTVYEIHEAQSLLSICIDVCNRIVETLLHEKKLYR